MSVRVFLEETGIWFGELRQSDGPPQWEWPSSNPLGAQTKPRGRGRVNLLSLHTWAEKSILSCPWTSVLLVLGLLHQDLYHWPLNSQAFSLRLNYTPLCLLLHIPGWESLISANKMEKVNHYFTIYLKKCRLYRLQESSDPDEEKNSLKEEISSLSQLCTPNLEFKLPGLSA